MKRLYILSCVLLLSSNIPFGLAYPGDADSSVEVKSLTSELLQKDSARRNPKFAFNNINIPIPGFPGFGPSMNDTETDGTVNNPSNVFNPGSATTATATIGSSAILIKGGLLKGLAAIKAAIVPPIFLGAMIVFLIAGAAFFACSILDCGKVLGGGGGFSPYGTTGGFGNPFQLNRNSYDQFEQQQQQSRPVFQALEDSYKKYNN